MENTTRPGVLDGGQAKILLTSLLVLTVVGTNGCFSSASSTTWRVHDRHNISVVLPGDSDEWSSLYQCKEEWLNHSLQVCNAKISTLALILCLQCSIYAVLRILLR